MNETTERPLIKRIREIGRLEAVEEAVSNAPLDEILTEHELKCSKVELTSALRNGLQYYTYHGPYNMQRAMKAKTKARRQELERVQDLAADLKNEFEANCEWLSQHMGFVGNKKRIRVPESKATSKFERFVEEDGFYTSTFLELLSIVPEAVQYEIDTHHLVRKGKPSQNGLKWFLYFLGGFWEEKQGKNFTVDQHDGVPTTPSMVFVADCIKTFDEVPDRAISSACRPVGVRLRADRNTPEDSIPFLSVDWEDEESLTSTR